MVKHLEDLGDTSKEILKTLKSGKPNGLTSSEIESALKQDGFSTHLNDVREGIKELIDYGSVRGYSKKGGQRLYYLSKGLGSGSRNQSTLLGKTNIFTDTYKFIQRIFGAVFLLFGFGSMILLGLSSTGKVILSSVSTQVTVPFYLSFLLMIIGGFLLITRSKK